MLTTHQLEAWHDTGFVILPDLFSGADCERWRAAADAVEQRLVRKLGEGHGYALDGNRFVDIGYTTVQIEHGSAADVVRVVEPVHEWHSAFDSLVDEPKVTRPMQQLLSSSDISLWTAKLNFKHAGVGSGFGWHQDSPYWIHDHDDVANLPNVMIAFDDADRSNGCLEVIAGSHKQGCLPGRADGSQLEGFYTHPDCIDEAARTAVEMTAGSAVFFHPSLIHGSQPNVSPRRRRAIIMTYQAGVKPALKSGQIRPVKVSHPA